MNTRSSRLKRIRALKRVAIAFAVAAIAAPSAQAYYPSEGVGASAAPSTSSVIRGENKATLHESAGTTVVRGEDKVGFREIAREPLVISLPSETGSFDWRDAVIGAAGGMALALLAASSLLAVRRARRSGLAPA
jgi:hypothetical protein